MFSLIIGTALAVASPIAMNTSTKESSTTCTAERLRPFVSPTGVRQSWPLAAELPPHLASNPGLPLSDQGNCQDGYSQAQQCCCGTNLRRGLKTIVLSRSILYCSSGYSGWRRN